jgi:hypothetical protein
MVDRRRERRSAVRVSARIQFPDADSFVKTIATDLTRTGMRLEARTAQPAGTFVRFELDLGSGLPILRGEGTVVGSNGRSIDVRFTTLAEISRERIAAYLARPWSSPHGGSGSA